MITCTVLGHPALSCGVLSAGKTLILGSGAHLAEVTYASVKSTSDRCTKGRSVINEDDVVHANLSTFEKWERYKRAKEAKSRWTAEEKAAKEELLDALGYDPEDEKPAPANVVNGEGEPIFVVRVGTRKGLDIKYLKNKHPDVYAECEKWTYPISIKDAEEA